MGGAILGLFPRESAEEDSGIAFAKAPSAVYLAYNTRSDAEVDEVLAQAEKAGGRIVKPAGRAFWGGWYGYFADADGHVWEVAHNPAFPIAEDGTISLPDDAVMAYRKQLTRLKAPYLKRIWLDPARVSPTGRTIRSAAVPAADDFELDFDHADHHHRRRERHRQIDAARRHRRARRL